MVNGLATAGRPANIKTCSISVRAASLMPADFFYQMGPFQIIFNPTSAAELGAMPKRLQLEILGQFRGIPQDMVESNLDAFGKLEKDGRTLYRFRLGEYRVYFARHRLGVVVHRILTRNTLKDFFFRSNLKLGEDQALQDNPQFWEQIENASGAKV